MQTRTTTVPRARFWTIGPNGHAVKLTLSPGHSLRWSQIALDGRPITRTWRHYRLADGRLPASKIVAFEHACGAYYVSEYLAGGAGRIVIRLPAGHPADAEELAGLQEHLAESLTLLIRCYRGRASIEETQRELTATLQAMAWHRANVAQLTQPGLDLGGDDDE
jgi:hypothetical protein